MTELEKEWREKECKFREAAIRFESNLKMRLEAAEIDKLENKVQSMKGDYVYITRTCSIKVL